MQQPQKKRADELTFSQKLEQVILKYRKPFIISISAVVLVLVVFGIAVTVQSRRIADFTQRVEQVQLKMSEYNRADETDKELLSLEIQKELDAIISGVSNRYPALRALMISGELAFQQERFSDAREAFLKAADRFSQAYLAPIALMNAAVSSEKLEDYPKAIEYYQRVVDTYGDTFQAASRALLNIGRLYEAQDNIPAAVLAYEQLTADFSSSEWAKLAQTRLIQIEIGM